MSEKHRLLLTNLLQLIKMQCSYFVQQRQQNKSINRLVGAFILSAVSTEMNFPIILLLQDKSSTLVRYATEGFVAKQRVYLSVSKVRQVARVSRGSQQKIPSPQGDGIFCVVSDNNEPTSAFRCGNVLFPAPFNLTKINLKIKIIEYSSAIKRRKKKGDKNGTDTKFFDRPYAHYPRYFRKQSRPRGRLFGYDLRRKA